jgi:hypothetical protein
MKKTILNRHYGGQPVIPATFEASVSPRKGELHEVGASETLGIHTNPSFRCSTPESRPCKESFAGIYGGIIGILLLLGSVGATAADQVYVCTPCPAGTYSDGTGAECAPCPAGTYSDRTGTECMECPAGSYFRRVVARRRPVHLEKHLMPPGRHVLHINVKLQTIGLSGMAIDTNSNALGMELSVF